MEWASEKNSVGSDDGLLKWLTEIQEEYLRLSELTRMEKAAIWTLASLIAGVQRSMGRPIPVQSDSLASFGDVKSASVVDDSLVIVDKEGTKHSEPLKLMPPSVVLAATRDAMGELRKTLAERRKMFDERIKALDRAAAELKKVVAETTDQNKRQDVIAEPPRQEVGPPPEGEIQGVEQAAKLVRREPAPKKDSEEDGQGFAFSGNYEESRQT